jgi:Predicted endonuclease distantly related to archaeal Holliday junction resolvase and Mrr-like restriction enzymes
MARTRTNLFTDMAALPWPVGIVAGIVGFIAIRYGIARWMGSSGGPVGQAFAQHGAVFAPLAWVVLALFWFAVLTAWRDRRGRQQLLDTRTGLDSLATLGWRQFELLVGEAFRRQGYVVEETGLGGADGGIDLILRRDGRRTLVQCKQWRRSRVPVSMVREMYGLLAHHGADAVLIVALGAFTTDAQRFAGGKPIELIGGEALLRMIREVQAAPAQARVSAGTVKPMRVPVPAPASVPVEPAASPACPRCGKAMVERSNRRTGEMFWGCAAYPACRGTR